MSEKAKRLTGRKPENVRRQRSKTDGAFGKETDRHVVSGEESRNLDKHTRARTARQWGA